MARDRYPPLADYAFLADCHSSALVSKAGSIDWCCMPRFDAESCFGRLLDWRKGGYCQIVPSVTHRVSRRYVGDSLVLEATFQTDQGEAKVDNAAEPAAESDAQKTPGPITSVIERSPESARIILVGSNTFAEDAVLNLASEGLGTLYTQPVEFLQNAIDWSLEDRGLLSIRSRAQFARTLVPMERSGQLFWEYLNYGLALLGLVAVWFWRRWVRQSEQLRYRSILAEV